MRFNTLLVILSQLVISLAPLLTLPHLTRTIGPDGLGVYSFSFAIAVIVHAVGQFGAQLYGRREIAASRSRADRTRVFWELSSLVFRITILSALIYLIVVVFLLEIDDLIRSALLAQIIYLFSGAINISWLLHGVERFRLLTLSIVLTRVINVVWIFVAVENEHDTLLYVYIMATTFLITSLLPWLVVHRFVDKPAAKNLISVRHLKPLRHFVVPDISLHLLGSVGIAVVGLVLSTTEVGFYDLAYRLARSPISLITAVGVVLLPRATSLISRGELELQKSYLHRGMALTMLLASLVAFGVIGAADTFVPMFAGETFSESVVLLQILAVSMLASAWANVLRTQVILPRGLDRIYSVSLVTGLIVCAGLSLALVYVFGAIGVAIALVLGEIVIALMQTIWVRKIIPLKDLTVIAICYITAGVFASISMYLMSLLELDIFVMFVAQVLLGVLVFTAVSVILESYSETKLVRSEVVKVYTAIRQGARKLVKNGR